jgi:hypothetical protein
MGCQQMLMWTGRQLVGSRTFVCLTETADQRWLEVSYETRSELYMTHHLQADGMVDGTGSGLVSQRDGTAVDRFQQLTRQRPNVLQPFITLSR